MKRKRSPVCFVLLCVLRVRSRCQWVWGRRAFRPKRPDCSCPACFSFLRLELEHFVFLWLVCCVSLGLGFNFLHSEEAMKAAPSEVGSVCYPCAVRLQRCSPAFPPRFWPRAEGLFLGMRTTRLADPEPINWLFKGKSVSSCRYKSCVTDGRSFLLTYVLKKQK